MGWQNEDAVASLMQMLTIKRDNVKNFIFAAFWNSLGLRKKSDGRVTREVLMKSL
jgi:hypothetical protein